MSTMYHGVRPTPRNPRAEFVVYDGICLTDSASVAETYAGRTGRVYAVECDVWGARHVDGAVDRDNMVYAGDDSELTGVVTYADEDFNGHQHQTWRVMTDAATLVALVSEVVEEEEEEDEDG
jgi:hypothetical protein